MLVTTTAVEERFLQACRGQRPDVTPVWFMRQAGRSLPEYRELRERHSILDICRTPELAAAATLQPVRRLGVDAAILFSDIVVPLAGIGVTLDIREGVGPVIEEPLRTVSDVDRLRPLEPAQDVPYVAEAVSLLKEELKVPLIGFAGAPFTLASYLVEGGPSKHHARTKALMYSHPETFGELMHRLAHSTLAHLQAQIDAGADAVQVFDSWAGALTPTDYRRYVLPAVARIFEGLYGTGAPTIYFGVTTGELLSSMARAGASVVGVDWRVPLDEARRRIGERHVVQGNLDPAACLAPWEVLQEKAREVLERGGGAGHVFNLGHGVLPETDPAQLKRLVDLVHGWKPPEGFAAEERSR
ncbi:MAG: uroporphyrinogen decarboxylase [Actinomycetota bacterium]